MVPIAFLQVFYIGPRAPKYKNSEGTERLLKTLPTTYLLRRYFFSGDLLFYFEPFLFVGYLIRR